MNNIRRFLLLNLLDTVLIYFWAVLESKLKFPPTDSTTSFFVLSLLIRITVHLIITVIFVYYLFVSPLVPLQTDVKPHPLTRPLSGFQFFYQFIFLVCLQSYFWFSWAKRVFKAKGANRKILTSGELNNSSLSVVDLFKPDLFSCPFLGQQLDLEICATF